ncbi:MAG: arginase [Planctomycetota bacterium]|nr:arginase [Planctomycetota bacterium]
MTTAERISLLGVPMDLGGGLRGVDMGPSAIRIAGLGRALEALGIEFEDRGNVPVPRPESRVARNPKARFLSEITHCCLRLGARVQRILEEGRFPLVVGGDHSIACGTLAGVSSFQHARGSKVGLIWFDAHADMNTPETTISGNIHGMPLAACVGLGPEELVRLGERVPMVDPESTVLIGIHDVDPREREVVRASGVKVFTMRDLDIIGMHGVMEEAIGIAMRGTAGFHLSFDLDGCDPRVAPGVTMREAHLLMEHAAESGGLLSLELTEINPILDERNTTAELAVELVLSAMGKRIL